MELKNFIVVDSEGETAVVLASDEKSARNVWKYAHPGAKVVSVRENAAG